MYACGIFIFICLLPWLQAPAPAAAKSKVPSDDDIEDDIEIGGYDDDDNDLINNIWVSAHAVSVTDLCKIFCLYWE